MRNVWFIFEREVAAYFVSPMAYVMGAVFLMLSGYFFSIILLATHDASMQGIVGNMALVILFIAPSLPCVSLQRSENSAQTSLS